MRKKKSILITCIGGGLSFQFIELLKSSSRFDYFVVGVDMSSDVQARHVCDVFQTVPHGSDPDYSNCILELAKQHSVELIFPWSDVEALSLSRDKEKFEQNNMIVACNDYDTLCTVSNKATTYEKLEELGIRTPNWARTSTLTEISELVENHMKKSESVVVKLPNARGSRGIFVLDEQVEDQLFYNNTREIHANPIFFLNNILPTLNPMDEYIVMDRLIEPVCDLDILAWSGQIVHALSRRRLESASPNNGHLIERHDLIINVAEKIVENMKLSWIFDIDYMFATDGSPIILEVNPRASGSLAVAIASGVNLFDDMFTLLDGDNVASKSCPENTVVYPVKSLRIRSYP